MHREVQLILVSPMIFPSILQHFYNKVLFATRHLAYKLLLGFHSVYTQRATVFYLCHQYAMAQNYTEHIADSIIGLKFYSLFLTWTVVGFMSLINNYVSMVSVKIISACTLSDRGHLLHI